MKTNYEPSGHKPKADPKAPREESEPQVESPLSWLAELGYSKDQQEEMRGVAARAEANDVKGSDLEGLSFFQLMS